MTIIDRRKNSSGKSTSNRQRFIERHKAKIKGSVDEALKNKSMKDLDDGLEVTIDAADTSEPTFSHDTSSGNKDYVLPGNKEFSVGDLLEKPEEQGGGGTGGGDGEDGEDEFSFVLTKEEFLDFYFDGLALPKFVKENMKASLLYKWRRAGYSKEGIPARLNIKKTMEQAIARRVATKAQGKKPRYLDDEDIRYDHFTKEPKPVLKAVMFCMMDVSASMGEHEKLLAKKFYLLLFLFLQTKYEHVEVRFVRHTTIAAEVDEHTFFYGRLTGGTIVSSGLTCIHNIIQEDYNVDEVNIYIAQTSDGDNWVTDIPDMRNVLEEDLLPICQYFIYLQIEEYKRVEMKAQYNVDDMMGHYMDMAMSHANLAAGHATSETEIPAVFREFFKEESK